MTRPGPRTPKPRPRRHAGASRTLQPTVSAVVRERTGSAWSRTRPVHRRPRLRRRRALPRPGAPRRCGLGGGRRRAAPRLRRCPLAECAIVHADRDLVVVDKPAGMPGFSDQTGAMVTMADRARTLLRGGRWAAALTRRSTRCAGSTGIPAASRSTPGAPRWMRITRTVGLSVTKAMIRMSDSRAREGRQRHVRRARSRRALHRRVDLALPDPARDARRAAALMAAWSEPPRTAPVSSNPEEILGPRLRLPSLQGLDRRSASWFFQGPRPEGLAAPLT